MLPVLKAVAFQELALRGGSSQPCIVYVTDENGDFLNDFYVVKIFKYEYEPIDIGKIVSYLADVKRNESKFLALLDKLLR